MKYKIEKEKAQPAYIQLYSQIRTDIINGVYQLNTKLPSKRMLAEETGISTITVEHAYTLLCEEGYIESRERSGYFVIFKSDDGFVTPTKKEPFLFSAMPQYTEIHSEFPFSVLAKTMRSVISNFEENILAKSPNTGCIELREAIRNYLVRSRGILADTNQIIIGSGSEYLYGLIVELLGRDKLYAIESPSYKKIEQVYLASDVCIEKLPLGNDGIDSSALRSCNANILHVSPYRSYPSGVTASASKRHEYIRWADIDGRYLIEDDFESEFTISKKPEETLFSTASRDNVIYMNTFSKTISSSLRVGYMILPKSLVKPFQERLGFFSCTVPTYIQFVLAELISNGDFERHINRVRRKKRKELQNYKQ